MRVAVADIGTNSCHLLIAESHGGSFRVIDSLKERTRLGECLENGALTAEGHARLEVALRRFRQLAQAASVADLRVYATSAMREATNGEAIAQQLRGTTGVYPRIISGEREGQLTYLGAASSVEFAEDNLLLDLGGGSLELVRGDAGAARTVVSLPLGSVRMKLAHLRKDPPSGADVRELMATVRGALLPHLRTFSPGPATRVIGSSGTFESIGAMLVARTGQAERGVNGFSFPVADLVALHEELRRLSLARRLKVPGLDPRRADIIVAGLTVLRAALEALGATHVTVSEGALREGMLVEYLAQEAAWEAGLSARQRSVLEVLERFRADLGHARQVTTLARELYATLERHGVPFGPEARSLLTSGAMLHEIGLIVGQSSHHKHGHYLVRHVGLRGYDPAQVEIVALLARYHRKSPPKPTHPEFTALTTQHQQEVLRLASILRVADGLDRSHTQGTRIRELTREGRGWRLRVENATELDLAGAQDKADLWAQTYGSLRVESVGGERPSA